MEKAGIDFNATNKEGMTPLLCHLNGSTNPDVSIFRLLISCGADIYALHPSSKKSILAHAIQNSQTEILDVVFETQYDVNKLECNGGPPILSCISLGMISIMFSFRDFFLNIYFKICIEILYFQLDKIYHWVIGILMSFKIKDDAENRMMTYLKRK